MSAVNTHPRNIRKLNKFMELMSKFRKDFIEFRDRVDVFFKNYLSILMGSSEEKRFDLYIEFSRLDLECKKLNKLINSFLGLIDQKYNEVSKAIEMITLNSPLERYNETIDYLNHQIGEFVNLQSDLLSMENKPLVYEFNNIQFRLNILAYIKYFKSVVKPSKMGNRENSDILLSYLGNIIKMFSSYVDFRLEECEKITNNPCPRVVNKEMQLENCPFIPNANLDKIGIEKDRKTIYVQNICGFDSIAHILLASIIDDPCYEFKLAKNQSREVELLFKLKANPINPLGLVKRYLVDTPGLKLTENTLDLETDIVAIWNNYFPSLYSGTFNCPHNQFRGFKHTLNIGYDPKVDRVLNKSTTGSIARKLTEYKYNFVISEDCDESCADHLQLADQLFIDIQYNETLLSTIDYFETELIFKEQKFRLAGVIENIQKSSKHFLAYVRRINGDWQIYDDLKGTMSILADRSLQISPVAVIYIRE